MSKNMRKTNQALIALIGDLEGPEQVNRFCTVARRRSEARKEPK